MVLIVGYIFYDQFKKEPLQIGFDWKAFNFACLAIGPPIILHEIGHKLVGIMFGMQAVFHAAWQWLILGLFLKLIRFNFIFFVPAFVRITGQGTPLQHSIIALAGPLVNLAIYGIAVLLLQKKTLKKNTYIFLHVTKQLNLFLFIFNMLPIPGFDGWQFYSGILTTIF